MSSQVARVVEKSTTGDVILWGLVLIAGIGILGVIVSLVRRWSFSTPSTQVDDGWSLQHLRELRERDEISGEEFEALKSRVIRSFQAEAGEGKEGPVDGNSSKE